MISITIKHALLPPTCITKHASSPPISIWSNTIHRVCFCNSCCSCGNVSCTADLLSCMSSCLWDSFPCSYNVQFPVHQPMKQNELPLSQWVGEATSSFHKHPVGPLHPDCSKLLGLAWVHGMRRPGVELPASLLPDKLIWVYSSKQQRRQDLHHPP